MLYKMNVLNFIIILFIYLPDAFSGRTGLGPGEEDWGHVEVRAGAHMFYWLFHTTADVDYRTRPLIIWLQGGPGAASTGFGNFYEIGLFHHNMEERKCSWVKHVNVLFVDSPVGVGFSYVNDTSLYAKTNKLISTDLINFTKHFFDTHTEFQNTPLYIFGESYGGKVAIEFGYRLAKEIEAENINATLKGIALGDPWISPIDSVLSWAEFLLSTGMVDTEGSKRIDEMARTLKKEFEAGNYTRASDLWMETEDVVDTVCVGIDFFNILYRTPDHRQWSLHNKGGYVPLAGHVDDNLKSLIDNRVKQILGIAEDYNWVHSRGEIFKSLAEDHMKPVVQFVEKVLNETELDVVVYTGQMDLVVATPGTLKWVENLNWSGISSWKSSERTLLVVDGQKEGYVKKHGRFSFYWVLRAGHMVPDDNPPAALEMMRRITKYDAATTD